VLTVPFFITALTPVKPLNPKILLAGEVSGEEGTELLMGVLQDGDKTALKLSVK